MGKECSLLAHTAPPSQFREMVRGVQRAGVWIHQIWLALLGSQLELLQLGRQRLPPWTRHYGPEGPGEFALTVCLSRAC